MCASHNIISHPIRRLERNIREKFYPLAIIYIHSHFFSLALKAIANKILPQRIPVASVTLPNRLSLLSLLANISRDLLSRRPKYLKRFRVKVKAVVEVLILYQVVCRKTIKYLQTLIYIDSPQMPPSASKMVSHSPASISQSPSKLSITGNRISKSSIQVIIPCISPPEDLADIQMQSPSSKAAFVTERQKRDASLDKQGLTLSTSNRPTETPIATTSDNSVTLQPSQLAANTIPNQATNHFNGSSAPQPTATLAHDQPSSNGGFDLLSRSGIQEIPRTSLVKATNNDYSSHYTGSNSWPTLTEIQGQQGQQAGITLKGVSKPLGRMLQNNKAISAGNHAHPQRPPSQQSLPQKRIHSEIIDLTEDEPQPQKKSRAAISSFKNVEVLDESLHNHIQQRNSVEAAYRSQLISIPEVGHIPPPTDFSHLQ